MRGEKGLGRGRRGSGDGLGWSGVGLEGCASCACGCSCGKQVVACCGLLCVLSVRLVFGLSRFRSLAVRAMSLVYCFFASLTLVLCIERGSFFNRRGWKLSPSRINVKGANGRTTAAQARGRA